MSVLQILNESINYFHETLKIRTLFLVNITENIIMITSEKRSLEQKKKLLLQETLVTMTPSVVTDVAIQIKLLL